MRDPGYDPVTCAHCDEGTVTACGEHGDEWPEPCDHCGGRGECDCAACHTAHDDARVETHCLEHDEPLTDGVCWICEGEDDCGDCGGTLVTGAGGAMRDCPMCVGWDINGPPPPLDQPPYDCHEAEEDWSGGAPVRERCPLCQDETYIGTPPTDCPRCYHPQEDVTF